MEVIFRVKWLVFVSWWCHNSGLLKVTGQFNHDGNDLVISLLSVISYFIIIAMQQNYHAFHILSSTCKPYGFFFTYLYKPIVQLVYLFQANCRICSTSLQHLSSSFKNLICPFFDIWIFFSCRQFIWRCAVVSCSALVIRGVCGLSRKRCIPKLRSSLF